MIGIEADGYEDVAAIPRGAYFVLQQNFMVVKVSQDQCVHFANLLQHQNARPHSQGLRKVSNFARLRGDHETPLPCR